MTDYKNYREKPRSYLKELTVPELKKRLKEVEAVAGAVSEDLLPLHRIYLATQREIDFIKDFIRQTDGAAMAVDLDPRLVLTFNGVKIICPPWLTEGAA